jgi:hypothetical protein
MMTTLGCADNNAKMMAQGMFHFARRFSAGKFFYKIAKNA